MTTMMIVKVLRSAEGRELRARHQENVRYLREKLLEAGLPVIHTPSHIIPVHVSSCYMSPLVLHLDISDDWDGVLIVVL